MILLKEATKLIEEIWDNEMSRVWKQSIVRLIQNKGSAGIAYKNKTGNKGGKSFRSINRSNLHPQENSSFYEYEIPTFLLFIDFSEQEYLT